MTLASGTRLGAYEILEPIGAGGMGEVYRAKDTRIDRTVAIKVLPTGLTGDAGLKQRFEREAKSISSLNHPHICTLYEFDSHEGTDFLVMEHLEGESLAALLERKGALPLETAVRYSIQIAEALDGAHRRGITHRDLKPGNIFLTDTGAKLLDFGLAKLADPKAGAEADMLSAVPTQAQPLTEQGAILGTFQYMAPEQQLEGQEADARTDVFAFGAVVYEMVTGKKAFEGRSQASLIGAILEREPEAMSTLQPLARLSLERVVKKCLAKAPDNRYHSIHDLADDLRWISEGAPSSETVEMPAAAGGRLQLGISFLVGAVLAGLAFSGLYPGASAPDVARFAAVLPEQLADRQYTVIAIAPDGKRFAYVANGSIHVRELDQLEARSLPGTEGSPRELAFSPDGEWIAYYDNGQLMKTTVAGGAPLRLCEVGLPQGLDWAEDDTLHFGGVGGVWQVPGSGGTPELVMSTSVPVWRPQLLPDGRTFLFVPPTPGAILLQSTDDEAPQVLFEGAIGDVRYLATGHLVFQMSDDLFAVSFDAERLSLVGSPVPVIQGSDYQYDVSRNGTLLYLPMDASTERRLVWVDRNGVVTPAIDERQPFQRPHLSADGRRVVVEVTTGGPADIWVYDLERGTRTRVTDGGGDPVMAPNGETIVFRHGPIGNLYSKAADGSGDAELLLAKEVGKDPHSFSPDGKRLAYYERAIDRDIWVLDLEEMTPEPFVVTEFNERSPSFSPDGHFIAYTSNASGQDEIYVQPYPGPGRRTVISTEGGYGPVWSRDGRELFYRNGDRMMAVTIETESHFRASTPRMLFEGAFLNAGAVESGSRSYDVSPDGRFLMIESREERSEIHIVLNWLEELEARVPGAR